MDVRLDDLEYRILCEVADHYRTTPAQLAKRIIMYRAEEIYVSLKGTGGGVGDWGGVDALGTPPPDHPTPGRGGTP